MKVFVRLLKCTQKSGKDDVIKLKSTADVFSIKILTHGSFLRLEDRMY